jgi:hypothetical protein
VDRQALAVRVLVCQGCGYAWEPAGPGWTAEHLHALAQGFPECGDWLYLGELADPPHVPYPRKADG